MPKIVDHEAYRATLVEAAVELFASQGYGPLTMRKLAAGLSVSTGTLYHYFANKQAIFAAVVEHITQLDSSTIEPLLALPVDQRLDALLAYADANQERFAHTLHVLTEVFRLEGLEGDVVERVRTASKAYVVGVALLLELPDPNLASAYLALIDGLIFQHMCEGRPLALVAYAPLFRRLVGAPKDPR